VSASDQLRNLHKKMTPSPWEAWDHDGGWILDSGHETISDSIEPRCAIPLAALRNALPLIADAIAAAETVSYIERIGILPDFQPLADSLAALEDALKEATDD
jgi:hypothetical protein